CVCSNEWAKPVCTAETDIGVFNSSTGTGSAKIASHIKIDTDLCGWCVGKSCDDGEGIFIGNTSQIIITGSPTYANTARDFGCQFTANTNIEEVILRIAATLDIRLAVLVTNTEIEFLGELIVEVNRQSPNCGVRKKWLICLEV